ncbi:MAG TPA: adenylate/guanylate cyclase domain-containing protein [Bacteroidia bacterium]|nr:adenylate/guanylate cyclase domain-containing protein [Bacteroidia bacterium]
MQKIISGILLIFYSIICQAQNAPSDSLKAILETSGDDTSKVNILLAMSKSYFGTDPNEAVKIGMLAKELSEKINYKKGVALALKNTGLAYYKQGKYVEALNDWNESKKIFESMGDKQGVANMLSNLGVIYLDQADSEKALELYLQALKIAEEIKDSSRIMTVLINIGAIYGEKNQKSEKIKAIDYDKKALPYAEAMGDNDAIGTITANLGEIYLKINEDSLALFYLEKSHKAYEGTENLPYSLNLIGQVYAKRKEFSKALEFQKNAFDIAGKLDAKLDMTKSLIGMADTYREKKDIDLAISNYHLAESLAKETGANLELKKAYEGLTFCYSVKKDFSNAFNYQNLLIGIKDTLYNIDTDRKLGTLLFGYEIDKKQSQISLLTKDKEIQEQEIKRQRLVRNGFIGGFAVVLLFAGVFFTQRNRISKEKKRSDELLLNILPEETAEELKATGSAKAKSFDLVSVLFTDFKNFTQASEKLSPEELVQEINHCYSEFDKIITKHGIEKIKTIGDAYMCAGGLPVSNSTHPFDVVSAGLEMVAFIEKNKQERIAKDQPFFELRLGIHTGPVVAGIVGIKKFAYDIWGDTVNTASRMESSGEIGKVNISGATYELVKEKFNCVHRGKVKAKNKGEIDMYFVEN